MAAGDITQRVLAGGNFVRAHTVTNGTTPTLSLTVAFTIDGQIESASVTKQPTGQYDVSIKHVIDNAALQTYLEANISTSTSGGIAELVTEDGVKELAQSSSNQTQLLIVRGGLQGGTAGAARKAYVGPQRLKSESGGYEQTAEQWTRVNLAYEGYKLGGALAVALTCFNSISTTPAIVTLTTSQPYGTVIYA